MAGVDPNMKVQDWNDDQVAAIRNAIAESGIKVEGECRSQVQLNIKRLMDIGCYRGIRHRLGLPVRGQSTKNNARTARERRKPWLTRKKQPSNNFEELIWQRKQVRTKKRVVKVEPWVWRLSILPSTNVIVTLTNRHRRGY